MCGDAESHTEAPPELVLNSQVHKMPGSGGISQPSSCATPEQIPRTDGGHMSRVAGVAAYGRGRAVSITQGRKGPAEAWAPGHRC